MIDLHYWTTPNGHKVTMMLEETGTPYKIFPVNIGKGEQFKADFLAISPNNRIPAMVDHDPPGGGEPISVFESGGRGGASGLSQGRYSQRRCALPQGALHVSFPRSQHRADQHRPGDLHVQAAVA